MTPRRSSALAVIALLAGACGGAGSVASTTTAPASTSPTTASTSTSVLDTTTTTLDPRSLEGMLAALDTDRSTPPTLEIDTPFGPADDAAAAAITDEIEETIGASLSGLLDLRVFPVIDSEEVLLILRVATDVEDEEFPAGLLEALVGGPTADAAGVTMLVMVMTGTDEAGDFELTIAVPWSDARAAVVDGEDVTDRVGVQITRNGQVVDG